MSVTVDHQPLSTDSLGIRTVGQVISHLQKANRLIVHVLIDGQEPNLDRMGVLRQASITGHTIFIETAEPKRMALDVLDQVEHQLDEADRLKNDAVDLLRKNLPVRAMEKLRGCFSTWQHAQESIQKTAQLLRIDLKLILVDNRPFVEVLDEFSGQLRSIKSALEDRDYVSLCDILTYEATETTRQWRDAIQSMRTVID